MEMSKLIGNKLNNQHINDLYMINKQVVLFASKQFA